MLMETKKTFKKATYMGSYQLQAQVHHSKKKKTKQKTKKETRETYIARNTQDAFQLLVLRILSVLAWIG